MPVNDKIKDTLVTLFPYLLLVLVAFALYAESFGHQWAMDDHVVVVQNQDIRSWSGFLQDNYPGRPLRELTYLLDYKLFGLNPAGYHFQNLLWHGLNASLLVLVVKALGAGSVVAWCAGLLFLLHPINVEVVANISHRKDSLMLFFVQLGLLALIRFYRSSNYLQKIKTAGFMGLFVTLASFAKQAAAGFLPLGLGYELTHVDPKNRVFLKNRKVIWVASAAIVIFAIVWYLRVWQGDHFQESIVGSLIKLKVYSGWNNELYLLVILKSLAFMTLRLVWPFSLAMEYVFDVPSGWLDLWVLSGVSLLAVAGLSLCFLNRRMPLITLGLVWVVAFWLPVSNLLWPVAYFAADRYMYACSAGFAIILASTVTKLFLSKKTMFYVLVVFLISGMGYLTWQQNRVWQDELHLFEQALKVSPGSTQALMGLGVEHMEAGQFNMAQSYFEKAATDFNDSKSLYFLGQVYEEKGDVKAALRYYQRFIMMNEPRYRAEVMSLRNHLRKKYGITR